MIYHCEQNTPDWEKLRLGRITASRIIDVVNYKKTGGEGADRIKYRWELVAERMTGYAQENSAAYAFRVKWGHEHERFARESYGLRAGVRVERIGFVTHPSMEFSGGSPDALIDGDGVMEVKCPESLTYLKWVDGGICPPDHVDQCQWNICCAERDYCQFVAYDPRQKEQRFRMFTVRVPRDDKRIAELESEVARFNDEIEAQIAKMGKTLTDQLKESLNV